MAETPSSRDGIRMADMGGPSIERIGRCYFRDSNFTMQQLV
ncbi:hypothetical protein Nizo1840_0438 [Lactiplantibacillus plantarum]|nr:hypothetical protein Nizo1840_0438 [Lactiplantibacillus plantarum]